MIGTTIDRFRVLGRIGQGGMGTVWRAEDTLLQRPVALKLLAEDLAESQPARLRFLREARAASALSHPCVATVYGAGEFGPHVYIALALIDGETVADCAARAPFELGDVVRLGVAVAEALGHAHGRGVIHRDITSRNIMIDREGRVFVLDFGLAMMVDRTRLTTTTAPMGTAAYMAPEVALGGEADPRADLYGLGVVLYEALTGSTPFLHDRIESLLYAAVHEAPAPPSTRRGGVPPALDRVILKLLEKLPDQRHANADALLAELRELEPAAGTRVGHVLVAPGTQRAAGVAIRDAVLVFEPFRDLSDPSAPGESGTALAAGLSDVVRGCLAQAPGLEVIALPADRPTGVARDEARASGARTVLSGSVKRIGARLRLSYSLVEASSGVVTAGETIDGTMDTLFDLEDRLVASVLAALKIAAGASHRTHRGPREGSAHQSYVEAVGLLQQTHDQAAVDSAIALLEELRAKQPDSATIQAALGRAYGRKYALRSEREWEIKAAEACQRALDLDPHAPDVFATIGDLHVSTGRAEEAIEAFRNAIELRPEHAEAWSGVSLAYLRANRFTEAEEACRRVIALRPNDWIGYNRLGIVFFRQGRFAAAVEPWRRVTHLAPENSVGHLNLAGAYFNTDRWDEAAAEYRRSLEIKPTSDAWAGLGSVLYYRGAYAESFDAFESALRLNPMDPRLWGNLASACDCVPERAARGAEALDRAIALMLERLEINPNAAEDWMLLATWRADRKQPEPARAAIERALTLASEDAMVMGQAVVVYHTLGDRPEALRWLDRALAHGFGIEVLLRNPALASMREDPEFQRIIQRRSAVPVERAPHNPP